MKPSYLKLKENHYSSNELAESYVDGESLYSEIGYSQKELIRQNSGYVNTCAVRMSLALLKSGVSFVGRLEIKKGEFKGKTVEPGAKLLADQLMRPMVFGRPQIHRPSEFITTVAGQKGVVLFWKVTAYGGGHIDVIETSNTSAVCNSNCYFSSKEIWFWPLA